MKRPAFEYKIPMTCREPLNHYGDAIMLLQILPEQTAEIVQRVFFSELQSGIGPFVSYILPHSQPSTSNVTAQ